MSHHYQFCKDRFCDLICTRCVFSNILKLPASKSGISLLYSPSSIKKVCEVKQEDEEENGTIQRNYYLINGVVLRF